MLPREYTRVEWIESTGSQYIDTGFKPNQDTRVVIQYGGVNASEWVEVFGAGQSVKNPSNNFLIVQNANNGVMAEYGAEYYTGPMTSDKAIIDLNKNKFYVNGILVHTFSIVTFTSPYAMRIFDGATQAADYSIYSGKVYSCQIYDNGTLIRDYIPCIDANGVANLWDDVNETLATKVGTFTAGPAIPAPSAPASLRTALAVRLLWDPVSAADYYNIYRDGELIGTTTDAQYIDTTAAENATYTYGISAANGGGESAQTQITVYTRTGYFLYKPYITTANFP